MNKRTRLPIETTVLDQLTHWAAGQSQHNDSYNECCPDFSCCNDTVQTPLDERREFLVAHLDKNKRKKNLMLGNFLAGAFAEEKVFVVDGESEGGMVQ